MDHTVLLTHLKIILLQCFQYLIFNKINGIQTDLKSKSHKFLNNALFLEDDGLAVVWNFSNPQMIVLLKSFLSTHLIGPAQSLTHLVSLITF